MTLDFLFVGHRKESKYFSGAITDSESPERIRVAKSLIDVDRFVYPLRYIPPSPWLVERGRPDDPGFEYMNAISPEVLDGIRSGKGVLLIDSSNEQYSPLPDTMTLLHERLKHLAIPFNRAVLLTQNTSFENYYKQWLQAEGIAEGMPIYIHHYFMRQLANYVTREMIPSGEHARRLERMLRNTDAGEVRDKHFLSLTFTPRPHRVAMMLYILQQGLFDKGIFSFPGLQNRKLDLRDDILIWLQREPFPDLEGLVAEMPRLLDKTPIELDVDRFARVSPVIDIGQAWYYESSYFSLVTDSGLNVWGGSNRNFTEKPLKALLGLHPMLFMGLPHALEHLRSFGFKSFAPVLDESYDGMEDSHERLAALLGEFSRLCALSRETWCSTYAELRPVLVHNFNAFAGPLQQCLRDRLEAPILDHLNASLSQV